MEAAGTCSIDARVAASGGYAAANDVQSFVIGKAHQTIRFEASLTTLATVGGVYTPRPIAVNATASDLEGVSGINSIFSELPVTITLDPASSGCTLASGTVSFTAVGTCVIDARQVGDADFQAAPPVQQSISVWAPFDTSNPASNDTTLANDVSSACGFESTGCEEASIRALDAAMTGEGLNPTSIPSDFWSLPYDQQLLLLANGDRTARGLPPASGPEATLDADAMPGAETRTDPTGAGTFTSNWAATANTVEAEFYWVYDDSWGGSIAHTWNVDCTSATAGGCWGHRQDILAAWPGTTEFGGACVIVSNLQCAEILDEENN
jgi:hypothetical protein